MMDISRRKKRPPTHRRFVLVALCISALYVYYYVQSQGPLAAPAPPAGPSSISSSSSSSSSSDDDDNDNDGSLIRWIRRNGGRMSPAVLPQRIAGQGKGIVARRGLNLHEELVVVPAHLWMSEVSAGASAISMALQGDERLQRLASGYLRLALHVEFERKQGHRSPWATFLRSLPARPPSPLFFERRHVAALGVPLVGEMVRARQADLHRNHAALFRRLRANHSDMFPAEDGYTVESFAWSVAMVLSRSFRVIIEPGQRPVWTMVPLVDFVNHRHGTENAYVVRGNAFRLRTSQTYRAGAQVFITYGPWTSRQLLLSYGMVLPDNPHDYLVLVVTDAQLGRAMRRGAARAGATQRVVVDRINGRAARIREQRTGANAGDDGGGGRAGKQATRELLADATACRRGAIPPRSFFMALDLALRSNGLQNAALSTSPPPPQPSDTTSKTLAEAYEWTAHSIASWIPQARPRAEFDGDRPAAQTGASYDRQDLMDLALAYRGEVAIVAKELQESLLACARRLREAASSSKDDGTSSPDGVVCRGERGVRNEPTEDEVLEMLADDSGGAMAVITVTVAEDAANKKRTAR